MTGSAPEPEHRAPAWQALVAAALVVAAGCAAYANSFDGVFLYDDFNSITHNRHIRSLWPLSEAMSRPMRDTADTVSTRPLLSLTFALNLRVLGPDPWGFHAVNLATHLATALLVLALVRRIALRATGRDRVGLALAVAALWVAHPLNSSAVTYIVQRAESLGGLLLLLSLWAAARGFEAGRPTPWFGLSVIACALGAAAKETVAMAAPIVLAYDHSFVSRSATTALRRRWPLYIGLCSGFVVVFAFRAGDTGELLAAGRAAAYAATQPEVILYYLKLTFWPWPLVMSYEWPLASSPLRIVAATLAIGALAAASVHQLRARAWSGFAGAFFFLALAPSSSFVGLLQPIMEHRMYLALIPVVAIVVAGADRALALAAERWIPVAGASALRVLSSLLAVVALVSVTHSRNVDYHDEVAFWRQNLEHRPDNDIAYLQLGRAQLKTGDARGAADSLLRAIELEPSYERSRNDLGRALLALGEVEAAREQFERALAIEPTYPQAANNLGLLSANAGDTAAAARYFRQALANDPGLVIAHVNLAGVLEKSGDAEGAERHYRAALELAPDFTGPRNGLATLLARQGRLDEAAGHFEAVLAHDSDDADALANFGALLAQQGALERAQSLLERAVAAAPDLASAHSNLARVLEQRGDRERSLHHHRRAAEIAAQQQRLP